MKTPTMMRIVRDTREQDGFSFEGFEAEVVEAGLATGDYSLLRLEAHVCVERKSLPDLVGSLSQGRDRFEAELTRMRGMSFAAVVCEGSWADLAQGNYRSRMTPQSACQRVLSLQVKNRVPFLFCGSRAAAEWHTYHLLRHYLRAEAARLEHVQAHLQYQTEEGDQDAA